MSPRTRRALIRTLATLFFAGALASLFFLDRLVLSAALGIGSVICGLIALALSQRTPGADQDDR